MARPHRTSAVHWFTRRKSPETHRRGQRARRWQAGTPGAHTGVPVSQHASSLWPFGGAVSVGAAGRILTGRLAGFTKMLKSADTHRAVRRNNGGSRYNPEVPASRRSTYNRPQETLCPRLAQKWRPPVLLLIHPPGPHARWVRGQCGPETFTTRRRLRTANTQSPDTRTTSSALTAR